MKKYLYVVSLSRGRSHPQHSVFYKNVDSLNAKSSDFGGINNTCVLAHHLDAASVLRLCSEGIRAKKDVSVEEVTRTTLNDNNSHHRIYSDLINNYFLPYDDYPNV